MMEKLNILIVEDNKIVVMGIKKIYNKHIPDATITSVEKWIRGNRVFNQNREPSRTSLFYNA